MQAEFVNMALICALGGTGLYLIACSRWRSAADVAADLSGACVGEWEGAPRFFCSARWLMNQHEAARLGLFERASQARYMLMLRISPVAGALILSLMYFLYSPGDTIGLVVFGVIGLSAGYLFAKKRLRHRREAYVRELEYFLPVVMERLVMGVEAGLDIIGACAAVVRLEREAAAQQHQEGSGDGRIDAVTRLLEMVLEQSERGMGFEDALKHTSAVADALPVKHAFVHLALAYKEGGELIAPLRELSDATQLYYQETLEEQIAKLPVKATLPLLCTFSGLIVCLLTAPIIQVIKILGRAAFE